MKIMHITKIFFLMIIAGIVPLMPFTLMIDPAGHAQQTGRKLWTVFERAETFKCAEALKIAFENYSNTVRVILTRAPGEEIIPLQNASFANRLGVDFFLRIQCTKDDGEKPSLTIYYHEHDPLIDKAQRAAQPYAFTPIAHAHFHNIGRSISIAQSLNNALSASDYQKNFLCNGTYGLPLKPLVGITAPALIIEIGLCADDQWQLFVDPIVRELCTILNLTNGTL
ncbi:MAG: N-acetylmuramoyl-L-alanine amidase [Candidatus Babeliales bacterium]